MASSGYGEQAVGYVQVKRMDGGNVHVKGRITPKHRVRSKPNTVFAIINTSNEKILSCECLDCAASAGNAYFIVFIHLGIYVYT